MCCISLRLPACVVFDAGGFADVRSTSSGPSLKDVDHIKKQVRNRATSDWAIEVIHLGLGTQQGREYGRKVGFGESGEQAKLY